MGAVQEDVVSRTRTNLVRVVVGAMLALSACLVAWWPQSAAGSDDGSFVQAVALATQKTPTPTKTPTATVAPTQAPPTPGAPRPAAPPPASPTKKPTKKPSHSGNGGKAPTLHNNHNGGGSHSGSGGSGSHTSAPATHAPQSGGGSTTVLSAAPPAFTPPPSSQPAKPTAVATTEAVAQPEQPVSSEPTAASTDATEDATDDAAAYDDAYLTSSEPVQTKSAPVWVVPGILLVLTSMLALLGGVLGRGNRPATVPVETDES